MKPRVFRIVECQCPHCGAKLNSSIDVDFEDAAPREGDYSICIHCAGVSLYESEKTLRKLTHLESLEAYRNEDVRKGVFAVMGLSKL